MATADNSAFAAPRLGGNIASGASGSGGAILNKGGVLNVNDSTFSINRSQRAGGAIETVGGSVTLVGSTLSNNSTGGAPGNGGALHVSGDGRVTLLSGTINSNVASAEGGGLWISATGSLVLDGTLVRGNAANGTGNPDAPQFQQDAGGGGIYSDGGSLTIRNAAVEFNTARGDDFGEGGGGVFSRAC